ncbi:MAG: hypothetical protein RR327_04350 [Clostridia bacterium]
MDSVQFANPLSGPLADKIGWLFYGTGATFPVGAPPVHVANSIPGGYTVEFDISNVAMSPGASLIRAVHTPVYSLSAFGNTGYTGIPGDVALFQTRNTTGLRDNLIKLDNIVVKDANGVVQTKFKWVAADTETLDTGETWVSTTNGSPWSLLTNLPAVLGAPDGPAITGLGTTAVTDTGTSINHATGPVFITTGPRNISTRITTGELDAVTYGIIIDPFETPISGLVESVALEETGISHILNAEGEKIQAMLAIPGVTAEQLLDVNKSVQDTTNSLYKLESALQSKLKTVGL